MAPRPRVLPEGLGARGAGARRRRRRPARPRPRPVGERRGRLEPDPRPRGRPRQPPEPAHQADLWLRGLLHHGRLHREGHPPAPLPPDPARQERDRLRQPHEDDERGRLGRHVLLLPAHHARHAPPLPRGHHLHLGVRLGHHPAHVLLGPARGGAPLGAHLQGDLRRGLLPRGPGPRPGRPQLGRVHRPHALRADPEARPRARHQGHRHQRQPLPHARGRPHAGRAQLHRHGLQARRRQPQAHDGHRVLHQE